MGGSENRQFIQKAAVTVSSGVKNPKSYSFILKVGPTHIVVYVCLGTVYSQAAE